MIYLTGFCIFAAIVFTAVYVIDRRRSASMKLATMLGVRTFDMDAGEGVRFKGVTSLLEILRKRLGPLLPGIAVGEYNQKLEWAGRPFSLRGEEFYIIKLFLGLTPPIVAPLVVIFGASSMTMLLLILLGIAGFLLPDLWLSSKVQNRQKAIEKELLSFIDILAVCADAGLNLSDAIKRTVEHQGGVLSGEFARALREMETGKSRHESLEDLGSRCGVDELESLVRAINQAERYGTPIASMLREQAKLMRVFRRNKAQEIAQTAGVKILAPVIVCNFLPLVVILLGPAVITLSRSLNL